MGRGDEQFAGGLFYFRVYDYDFQSPSRGTCSAVRPTTVGGADTAEVLAIRGMNTGSGSAKSRWQCFAEITAI